MTMDITVKNRLQEVVKRLEETKGGLKLFACVWRDSVKRWDIVVSATWVDYGKSVENLGDMLDATKATFNGEYSLRFYTINPLKEEEPFVQEIIKLLAPVTAPVEFENVSFGGVNIEKMVLFVAKK